MTLGGFGLTGYITSARIQLVPLKGNCLHRESIWVPDLDAAVEVMEQREGSTDAVYSWNNLNLTGSSYGAGIVYAEQFCPEDQAWRGRFNSLGPESRRKHRWSVLNRVTIPMMNRAYLLKEKLASREARVPIEVGTFPINGKEIYYTLFGARGLREYQALVPRASWKRFSDQVRDLLNRHRVLPTLASLKLFRGTQSLLKFNGTGVCLTIDVPSSDRSVELFNAMDRAVLDAGGCVNLSKDSRIPGEVVRGLFPEYDRFRTFIRDFDVRGRFTSSLRRRLID